jgi:hypothetical protein
VTTLDLRAGRLDLHGNAGAAKVIVTTWTDSAGDAYDLTGSTVSLWFGGTVSDPTDLTDASEVAAVIDANTATFTLTVPDTRQPIRMTLDGPLVPWGGEPDRRGDGERRGRAARRHPRRSRRHRRSRCPSHHPRSHRRHGPLRSP